MQFTSFISVDCCQTPKNVFRELSRVGKADLAYFLIHRHIEKQPAPLLIAMISARCGQKSFIFTSVSAVPDTIPDKNTPFYIIQGYFPRKTDDSNIHCCCNNTLENAHRRTAVHTPTPTLAHPLCATHLMKRK